MADRSRIRWPSVASLLVALLLAAGLPGQSRPGRRPVTAESALATFERQQGDPEERRVRGVRELGAFDGEAVVAALVATWEGAKNLELKLAALQALSERERPGHLGLFAEAFDQGVDLRFRDAAAVGLGRYGAPGTTLLLERLEKLEAKKGEAGTRTLRLSLLTGLATARTDAAVAALAKLASDDKDPERHEALRRLADVPASPSVTAARELAVQASSPPLLAVEGLRQLAAAQWPGTKRAAVELSRRVPAKALPVLHAGLVDAMALVLDEELYEPFLNHAGAIEADLDERHRPAMQSARNHAGFLGWLVTKGLETKSAPARVAAARILAAARAESAVRALATLARSDDAEVALAAVRGLASRGDAALVPLLRELAVAGSDARRSEASVAVCKLAPSAPETLRLLESLAGSPSPTLRTLAVDLFAELRLESAAGLVWKLCDDRAWTVRAAAYAYCRKVRILGSIPVLIGRLDDEKARLHDDVLDALEELTRMRFGDLARWQRWWETEAKTFVLPPPAQAAAKPRGRAAATVVGYYDIPLTSMAAAFVVDTSGSMAARIGTGGQTRLDETKRQLERIVSAMAEHVRFNLIFFQSGVQELDRRVGPADKKRKEAAIAQTNKQKPAGGTNIFDALERAYADPDVDTIYLLSDGEPSAGRIQDPDAIHAEVQRWNRTRRIVIHTISVGADSRLLKRLAELTGGEYRHVR